MIFKASNVEYDSSLRYMFSMLQDFLDEHYDIPKISMVNNVIHNNEGYGIVLVKPTIFSDLKENDQDKTEGMLNLVFFNIKNLF